MFVKISKSGWKYILVTALYLLFPVNQALADMVPPPVDGKILSMEIIFSIVANFLINSVILTIVYLILRKVNLVKSWSYLRYIFFVTIGGFLIDYIFVYGEFLTGYKGPIIGVDTSSQELLRQAAIVSYFFTFLTFIGLFVYNYLLSKKLFQLTRTQAVLIGLTMGILTNPIIFTSTRFGFLISPFL
jgi:hypothetical protein